MFHESQWKPMEARMNMVIMGEEFDGKTDFPYSCLDLACALQHMVQNPKITFPAEPRDCMYEALKSTNYKKPKLI